MIAKIKDKGSECYMLRYKRDILSLLKEAGYSTTRLRKEKILGESTIQRIRTGLIVDSVNLDKLCELLEMQPGELLQYFPEKE